MANVEALTEPDPEAVRIGEALRKLRRSYGWQIWRLGATVGRSRPNLSNIEAGRRVADPPLLRAIADAYGMTPPALVAYLYPAEDGHEIPRELAVTLLRRHVSATGCA